MTKYEFQAETGRILELLTHSIYSNKEIFLRELISNSSDAIDKAKLKSLTDKDFLGDDTDFKIIVELDEEKNTISISDNGIGMDSKEMQENLGIIAKSGTKEFLEKLEKAKQNGSSNLIGQFGVGFYSSFMVSDRVEVFSRSASGKKAYKWSSDGKTNYTLEELESGEKFPRGTRVTLYINEANIELVKDWKVRELIKKYSNYIPVSIMMREYDSRSDEEKKKEPKQMEFKQVNETKAIWKKDKKNIKQQEYKEFYQSVSFDWNDPFFTIHTNSEGIISYKAILFSPLENNLYKNLSDPNLEYGPKLYVQNVLILENAKELLPVWLRFISGVVETNDLPLNISREMLQDNSTLEKIKKSLVKKIVSELEKLLKNDIEKYKKFWGNYGKIIKEGIHYEWDMKDSIAKTCLFDSMNENKLISLESYLKSAFQIEKQIDKDGKKEIVKQPQIYYIVSKSKTEALSNPYLEQFREKNIDVLVLYDPIDNFLFQGWSEFEGAKLLSIMEAELDSKEEKEKKQKSNEKKQSDFKSLFDFIKNTIGDDKIESVELNQNLGTNLGALKTPQNGVNPQMEKIMKAMGQVVPNQKRILELNPKNPLLDSIKKEFEKDVKSQKLLDIIKYTYYQGVLLEGGEIENMKEFADLTNKFAKSYI